MSSGNPRWSPLCAGHKRRQWPGSGGGNGPGTDPRFTNPSPEPGRSPSTKLPPPTCSGDRHKGWLPAPSTTLLFKDRFRLCQRFWGAFLSRLLPRPEYPLFYLHFLPCTASLEQATSQAMRVNLAFLPFVPGLEPWLSHYPCFSHKQTSRHQLHCFSMAQKSLKSGSVTFLTLNQYISTWLTVLCSYQLTLQLIVKLQASTGVCGPLLHSQLVTPGGSAAIKPPYSRPPANLFHHNLKSLMTQILK